MDKSLGYYNGEPCNRNGCTGVIKDSDEGGCYCSATNNPPCSHCELSNERQYCPECDWSEENEKAEIAKSSPSSLSSEIIQKAVAQALLWNTYKPLPECKKIKVIEDLSMEPDDSYREMSTGDITVGSMYHFLFHDVMTMSSSFEDKLKWCMDYAKGFRKEENMKSVYAMGDSLLARWDAPEYGSWQWSIKMMEELGMFVSSNNFCDKYGSPLLPPMELGSKLMINRKFEHLLTGL